ncbi:MAG: hypothetical protein ACTSV6_04100, partial [Candidatus Heimdallarchaeota archaeon]
VTSGSDFDENVRYPFLIFFARFLIIFISLPLIYFEFYLMLKLLAERMRKLRSDLDSNLGYGGVN